MQVTTPEYVSEVEYVDGVAADTGTVKYNDGAHYEGEVGDLRPHGKGVLTAADGGWVPVGKAMERVEAAGAVLSSIGDAAAGMSTKMKIAGASMGILTVALTVAGSVYGMWAQQQERAKAQTEAYFATACGSISTLSSRTSNSGGCCNVRMSGRRVSRTLG